jgi:hypothetical protein
LKKVKFGAEIIFKTLIVCVNSFPIVRSNYKINFGSSVVII